MPSAPKTFRSRPSEPPAVRQSSRERGYSRPWDKASAGHRREHPLCGYCAIGAFGPIRDTPATCVDHLYPHRRFAGVFWRREYWVSSCDDCHDRGKQAVERRGRVALDALAERLGLPALEG